MEKYTKYIPKEFRDSVKALDNNIRQAIIVILYTYDSKSHYDLLEQLSISEEELKKHIDILRKYGLIYTIYTKNKFDNKYLVYQIKKLGTMIAIKLEIKKIE